jgi:hypothetical protein
VDIKPVQDWAKWSIRWIVLTLILLAILLIPMFIG